MSLRYPTDRPQGLVDFVTFQHEKYSGGGGGGGGGGGIVLYHPESTPAVSNAQNWTDSGTYFSGPLGQFKRNVIGGAAELIQNGDPNDVQGSIDRALDKLKGMPGFGAAARHYAMERFGEEAGPSANQIMSVTQGKIYNPNVEMFYNGPILRSFTFTFNFAPKTSADGQAAMNIIREFKKWSSPKEEGGKYEIPHVWRIKYSNQNYNKFKRAALMNVNVDFNAGLDQHMTFVDNMPLITTMSLTFNEVEMVTRDDHSSGSGF